MEDEARVARLIAVFGDLPNRDKDLVLRISGAIKQGVQPAEPEGGNLYLLKWPFSSKSYISVMKGTPMPETVISRGRRPCSRACDFVPVDAEGITP